MRETREETKKKMKKTNHINWISHNELNAEPARARINRLKRHNALLNIFIAVNVGVIIPLVVILGVLIFS